MVCTSPPQDRPSRAIEPSKIKNKKGGGIFRFILFLHIIKIKP